MDTRIGTLLLGGLLAATLLLAPPTKANGIDTLHTLGFANGSQSFGVTGDSNVAAGAFRGTWNGQGIVFFCIELTQFFDPTDHYYHNYSVSKPDGFRFYRLTELFGSAGMYALDSTKNSAAFQLAVWEIMFESPGNGYSLDTGGFRVTDEKGHGATVDLANFWLSTLGAFGTSQHMHRLSSRENQDFVFVPEPGTVALVAAGFLLAFALRRKAARVPRR